MFTPESSVYLRTVIDVAIGNLQLNDIRQDLRSLRSFKKDVEYVQSLLSQDTGNKRAVTVDTVTVSFTFGQGSQASSPTLVGDSVLYK